MKKIHWRSCGSTRSSVRMDLAQGQSSSEAVGAEACGRLCLPCVRMDLEVDDEGGPVTHDLRKWGKRATCGCKCLGTIRYVILVCAKRALRGPPTSPVPDVHASAAPARRHHPPPPSKLAHTLQAPRLFELLVVISAKTSDACPAVQPPRHGIMMRAIAATFALMTPSSPMTFSFVHVQSPGNT